MSRNGIYRDGHRFEPETLPVRLRATYTCWHWPDPEPDTDPAIWHGWCDPTNPWGTADDDYDPDAPEMDPDDEPIEITLPLAEAREFVREFPGAVWDISPDCDPSQNYRTGVYTSVTLHVGDDRDPYQGFILARL